MNEAKEFAARIQNIYIEHDQVKEVWKMLDSMRDEVKRNGKPRNLFVIGESGVGKSQILERYALKYPGYTKVDEFGTEIDIKPVLYCEIPNPFTILEFYQTIVSSLGAPNITGKPTIGAVKRQVFQLLKIQKTELLILDELDYIKHSRHVKPDEAMDTLKHVSNMANIPIVCIGTPEIEDLRVKDFQYYRRFIKKEITGFRACDENFCKLLRDIEDQIQPFYSLNLDNPATGLPELLHFASKGLVGLLTPLIIQAYRELGVFSEDFRDITKTKLTTDYLESAYKVIGGDIDEEEFQKMLIRK